MPSPRLEQITPDNVLAACAIAVRPDQEGLVAPVARSLAEAYAQPAVAWPRLIVDDDRPVGFLMAFLDIRWRADDPADIRSGLWRLNIAADQQGRGYGRFAVGALADELRRRGTDRMFVTWAPGPHGPERFYQRLGFQLTGETSGDQVVGVLAL
ncbi:GNAT family N-acetyltransferase [Micromonospora sp. AMSO31t]|uniref:GNAT family N-acetyltransferase n=1 Tax=Micromonospora sp. AMSO31t TaxID=2650566 RepID=UPI00124B096A|nr:GNAT family N-acetyltransferase [Micromonospora sp. AMSO31t]KAB1915825.1 GNAT family N-acetyltransferase [Micromonospora sp. AMSO31t]